MKNSIYSIQIPQNKGLLKCELKQLGKINVICGKNNSGKTTILEGIQSQGTKIEIKLTQYHCEILANLRNWSKPKFKEAIIDFPKTIENDVWQANEFGRLWSKLNNYLSNTTTHTLNDSVYNDFLKKFESFFKPKILYVPAKRNPNTVGNIATNQAINTINTGLINHLFTCKNSQVGSYANSNYHKLQKNLSDISAGYTFDITVDPFVSNSNPTNKISLLFSNDELNWRKAEDCGLGLRDLLLIITYSSITEFDLLLVEEPENHMNPEMQRKLLNFLKYDTDKQFFLSTHSNVFLDDSYVNKIYYSYMENSEVKVSDATSKANMLNDLGYSITDNLVSDLIILTEGPKDRLVLEEFLKKMNLIPNFNIKFWPLGGDIMGQLDLTVFVDSYRVIALIDQDPKSDSTRKELIRKCDELGIPYHRLSRYSIENYFTLEALREVFKNQISSDIDFIKNEVKLEDQIGINVKKKSREIAQKMKLSDIINTDLHEFLIEVKKKLSE